VLIQAPAVLTAAPVALLQVQGRLAVRCATWGSIHRQPLVCAVIAYQERFRRVLAKLVAQPAWQGSIQRQPQAVYATAALQVTFLLWSVRLLCSNAKVVQLGSIAHSSVQPAILTAQIAARQQCLGSARPAASAALLVDTPELAPRVRAVGLGCTRRAQTRMPASHVP